LALVDVLGWSLGSSLFLSRRSHSDYNAVTDTR
jgi:hypothetical protein